MDEATQTIGVLSKTDKTDDLPSKMVLAEQDKCDDRSPPSTAQSDTYEDEILQIKEDFPWECPDRCRYGLAKFNGNTEEAKEWLLTTMSESDVRHLEVQLVVVRGRIVWYRQKATQTDEDCVPIS